MNTYYLVNEDGKYVKSLDTENHKLEFTDDIEEAKEYDEGRWFAETELEFLNFHFKEYEDILKTMECKYIEE